MWKQKTRGIKRLAQGHRAVVAQSWDSNMLLAPLPAELAPLEEPACKWKGGQGGGLTPLPLSPAFVDLSFHSFFPRTI